MADHAITELLGQVDRGQSGAKEELLARIYRELHQIAAAHMARERTDHVLQPTALVHEAYVRVLGTDRASFANRRHLFGAFAEAMRQVLIDSARRSKAAKRGGGQKQAHPSALDSVAAEPESDAAAVAEILPALEREDARACEVVKLRFLAGLPEEHIATLLGVTTKTVQRDWKFAKAWLKAELLKEPSV